MRKWLIEHFDGERVSFYHDFEPRREFDGYFRFVTVRNPYERMYSLWAFLCEKSRRMAAPDGHKTAWMAAIEGIIPLAELYHSQGFAQSAIYDRFGAQDALRIEDIANQVKRLPFYKKGTPPPGHARKTPEKPTRSFFDAFGRDSEAAATIRRLYGEDFERFGYTP